MVEQCLDQSHHQSFPSSYSPIPSIDNRYTNGHCPDNIPESYKSTSIEGDSNSNHGTSVTSHTSHYDHTSLSCDRPLPTFSYDHASPTPSVQDDTISFEKKKKNKTIKRAMKHFKSTSVLSDDTSRSSSKRCTISSSSSRVSKMSSFFHMLPNTNPKSREQDFHKLFKSLPEGETLIHDFSCALLRDILVQGRMYISQNWFCFYANILGWETLLTIEVRKIIAIKKEKTALVINNAISISTHEEKYFFSSFMSRDSAHNHMTKLWREGVRAPPDNTTESEINMDEDNSEDGYLSDDEEDTLSTAPVYHSTTLGLVPADHVTQRETISFSAEDETCVCVSHYTNEHLNQDFDMNIEKMYKLLFNDESSLQSKMKGLVKMDDYDCTPWSDSLEGANERTLTYRVPLTANLGPKWAEVIEKQVLTCNSVAGKCYIVNCEVTNPNVPYGDKFNILKRYCLTRCGENLCRLRLTSDVQYRKGVWGMVKSIIEKNSKEGLNDYCEDLQMCLTEESAGPGVKVRKSTTGITRKPSSVRSARGSRVPVDEPSSRAQAAMGFVTDNYIAFILLMMAVLLMLNLILVYRLSSFTNNSCNSQYEFLKNLPQTEEGKSEWIKLLAKQQELHKKELERWQEVLRWISKLVSEAHLSLDKLQKSSIYSLDIPKSEL